jgi:hypothetical protein
MKVVNSIYFIESPALKADPALQAILTEVQTAILAVSWYSDTKFIINPTLKGNGVNPIKNNFIRHLKSAGWLAEEKMSLVTGMNPGPIDALKHTPHGLFAVEWETGNISSSHRALNKIALGILQQQLIGGLLVLPSRNLSRYLTDRIGNYEEIAPYFPLYQALPFESGIMGVMIVDYDAVSAEAPIIPKGKDGNADKNA